MRKRAEIVGEVLESNAENNGNETVRLLQLEVLLDIRDLLQQIVTVTIAAAGGVTDAKQGLHHQNHRPS